MAMKITAGLGSIDDYPAFCEAGADEVFCGYVPRAWMERFGNTIPINRREVLYYNVQIGSRSELQILADMRARYRVPVSITLNALFYPPECYPLLLDAIGECIAEGFDSFIIADPGLLTHLASSAEADSLLDRIKITVSGEIGEENHRMLSALGAFPISRLIFHRKVQPEEMRSFVDHCRQQACLIQEFEAFALNERCHYHGGFCNSLHCDELCHLCLLPYETVPVDAGEAETGVPRGEEKACKEEPYDGESVGEESCGPDEEEPDGEEPVGEEAGGPDEEELSALGASGCGLCALYRLREAGITHLKLVGRGGRSDDMIRDIRAMRRALEILETAEDEASYRRKMKEELFAGGCPMTCYYA